MSVSSGELPVLAQQQQQGSAERSHRSSISSGHSFDNGDGQAESQESQGCGGCDEDGDDESSQDDEVAEGQANGAIAPANGAGGSRADDPPSAAADTDVEELQLRGEVDRLQLAMSTNPNITFSQCFLDGDLWESVKTFTESSSAAHVVPSSTRAIKVKAGPKIPNGGLLVRTDSPHVWSLHQH